jgi:hypothetical protein
LQGSRRSLEAPGTRSGGVGQTERKHLPAKDVAAVGGWVDTTTLERCYQVADPETIERVVMEPRGVQRLA